MEESWYKIFANFSELNTINVQMLADTTGLWRGVLSNRLLWVVLEQISCQPLDWIGRALFDKGGHAVEKKGYHCLIEISTNGKRLQIELLLSSLQSGLGFGSL